MKRKFPSKYNTCSAFHAATVFTGTGKTFSSALPVGDMWDVSMVNGSGSTRPSISHTPSVVAGSAQISAIIRGTSRVGSIFPMVRINRMTLGG